MAQARRLAQRQAAQRKKRIQGGIFAASIGLTLVMTVALLLYHSENSISFEQAQNNRELRVQYINQMISKISDKPSQLREVRYIEKNEELPETLDATTLENDMATESRFSPSKFGKMEFPTTVFVFPPAFGPEGSNQTEADFISTLRHEFRHIEQYHNGIEQIDITLLYDQRRMWNSALIHNVFELDANKMEIHSHRISQSRLEARKNQYMFSYLSMWLNSEYMNPLIIQNLKVSFFECWMLNHKFFVHDNAPTTWSWYVEPTKPTDPDTPFLLTKAEVEQIKEKHSCQ